MVGYIVTQCDVEDLPFNPLLDVNLGSAEHVIHVSYTDEYVSKI